MEILIFCFIVSFILLYYIFFKIIPVIEGCRYIQMEIKRSFSEQEKEKWKRKRRKLILTLIPFVGLFR